MAWLVVNKDGTEWIMPEEPVRGWCGHWEYSESSSCLIPNRRCLKRMPSFFVMQPVYYPFLFLKHLWSSQLSLLEK